MLPTDITDRERAILAFVAGYCSKNEYGPSMREIGECIKINSTSLTRYYLDKLTILGLLKRHLNIARSVRITEAGRALLMEARQA